MKKTCLILYSSLKASVGCQKEILFFWTSFQVLYDNQVNISYTAMFFCFPPIRYFLYFCIAPFLFSLKKKTILTILVCCWKRIAQKRKWMSFRYNEFYFDKNENTFTVNECQRKVLFVFWWFWMFIHMQMLFLNVPCAQMKVILLLMRVHWS